MSEMARAIGRPAEAERYDQLQTRIADQFARDYLTAEAALRVDTQTAHVLALAFGLVPETRIQSVAAGLVERIAQNDHRMATGFLGTKPLLPVLTARGQHDLAVRLFQSRKFPSWGYEVEQGANTVWERWDSFTREHGFDGAGGNQNASMNSFSHYAFGAVMEWAFRDLVGIDTDGPGFRRLRIKPGPPAPGSNPDRAPIDWVKAEYVSVRGRILSEWKRSGERFELHLAIPANTSATLFLPARDRAGIREAGRDPGVVPGLKFLRMDGDRAVLSVESGTYRFESTVGL
jgi:alpha-L-rhamnosidase